MVTLLLNGQSFPSSLLGNLTYNPVVLVDGRVTPAERWTLSTGGTVLTDSTRTTISFALTTIAPHTLHVTALNTHGLAEETLVAFNVVRQGSGTIRAGVSWNKSFFQVGDKLEGTVYIADPEGFPPLDLSWTIYRNQVPVYVGAGPNLAYAAAIDGVYTVKISGHDIRHTLIEGETTLVVTQNYALQATPPVPPLDGSAVLLGVLYSDEMSGPAGSSSTLPYALASFTQEFYLPPGTTHVAYALDGTVDDEVVVRSLIGNFAINGYPSGLYDQRLGYDYRPNTLVPAPADLKIKLTFDAYNAHGASYSAFQFRVKLLCYAATEKIYRYDQCPYSIHPGGDGLRQRHLAFIFTQFEALVDTDTPLNRYQTGDNLVEYTTTEPSTIPRQWLLPDGTPYPNDEGTNLAFTEANRYAIYEAEDYAELDAKAVCAVENVRPFYFTVQMPDHPQIVQTIKRLKGRMVLYVANGGLLAGSVVNARIATGAGDVLYPITITEDVYNATNDTFVRAGAVDIDLSDFQFGINGVVVRCEIDESAVTYSGTQSDTLPAWSAGSIYSKAYGTGAVNFDGACFSSAQYVERLDATAGVVATVLTGCWDASCGPQGVYCYTANCPPNTAILRAVQPLYHPAPFIASPANPYYCYGNPVFVNSGSKYVLGGGTITAASNIIAYTTGSLCGDVSVYTPCNGGNQIAVIYPCSTTPHDYVRYGQECYHVTEVVSTTGTELPGLDFNSFTNWTVEGGTVDLIGESPVYTLYDLKPGNGMYVDLIGSPSAPVMGQFGTMTSRQAFSLPTPGLYRLSIDIAGNQRTPGTPTPFSVGVTVGSHGTAWTDDGMNMDFTRYRMSFTTTGSEYVTVKVFQNTASPWGTTYNAGNLLNYVHFYKVGPPQIDYLLEQFDYATLPTLPNTVVSVADVSAVADCQDYACSGSNPTGNGYVYYLTDTGSRVPLAFEGLDMGVPHFAVSSVTTSTGLAGLSGGRMAFTVKHTRQTILRSVGGTGTLDFHISLSGVARTLIRSRSGVETRYALSAGRNSRQIDVQPGDAIYLEFDSRSIRVRNKSCVVTWTARVSPIRRYHQAVLNTSGSVQAVGFCGLTNRSDYVLFSNLPADAQTATVVNPDALVTVAGTDGVEYALVRNAAYNEVRPPLPFPWYSGQSFNGSMTFSFYTGRHDLGAHGEMDVWIANQNGTFPPFFKISEFFALYGSNSYRCDTVFEDMRRNSVRVVPSLAGLGLPSQYAAPDGELRTVHTQTDSISTDKLFLKTRVDHGISYVISHLDVTSSFAAFSDFHARASNPNGVATAAMVAGWLPEYVISLGDLMNNTPAGLTTAQLDWAGDYWLNQAFDFYTAMGNHDWETVAGEALFRSYFSVPTPPYYDFVRGDIHWFILDTGYDNAQYNRYTGKYAIAELSGEMALTAQGIWLRDALAQSTSRWNIVVMHNAAYSSCASSYWPSGRLEYPGLRMPFKSWGASLVLFGHAHVYERLVAPDGLTHLCISPAGASSPASFAATPTTDATSVVRATGNWGALRGRTSTAGLTLEYYTIDNVLVDTITVPPPYWTDDAGDIYLTTDGEAIETRI